VEHPVGSTVLKTFIFKIFGIQLLQILIPLVTTIFNFFLNSIFICIAVCLSVKLQTRMPLALTNMKYYCVKLFKR
jgi:hypothetical protein